MTDVNDPKKRRKSFVTANEFQKEIVFWIFLPAVSIFLTFNIIVALTIPSVSMSLFHASIFSIKNSTVILPLIIVAFMCLFFIFSLTSAFIISHKMLGGFGRIIRELDNIIDGNSQKTIASRPNDTLTKELLKRINVLIQFYITNKEKR